METVDKTALERLNESIAADKEKPALSAGVSANLKHEDKDIVADVSRISAAEIAAQKRQRLAQKDTPGSLSDRWNEGAAQKRPRFVSGPPGSSGTSMPPVVLHREKNPSSLFINRRKGSRGSKDGDRSRSRDTRTTGTGNPINGAQRVVPQAPQPSYGARPPPPLPPFARAQPPPPPPYMPPPPPPPHMPPPLPSSSAPPSLRERTLSPRPSQSSYRGSFDRDRSPEPRYDRDQAGRVGHSNSHIRSHSRSRSRGRSHSRSNGRQKPPGPSSSTNYRSNPGYHQHDQSHRRHNRETNRDRNGGSRSNTNDSSSSANTTSTRRHKRPKVRGSFLRPEPAPEYYGGRAGNNKKHDDVVSPEKLISGLLRR
ncbi:hypothetical protein H4R99_008153 [Coemansia sp. RSA 1722]|nr:hypothetical protein IWW45_008893 [Coemansia sp. RSA 485]KAJ2587436.1 hypothetical protein H4R99_008153 [Coemansia sp. RSA 1722]